MADTIHHVPGRIRIRMAALRRDPRAAARVRQLIGACRGVLQVEANPITGSLLVRYDPQLTSGRNVLDSIALGGFVPPCEHADPLNRLVDAAISMAVDKVIERGAVFLLAAII